MSTFIGKIGVYGSNSSHVTITCSVGVHNRDHCTITGNVDVLNGDYCTVSGSVRVLNGDHCSVGGNVHQLNGDHNKIKGSVTDTAAGNYNQVGGLISNDVGSYNISHITGVGEALHVIGSDTSHITGAGGAINVMGSGNNVVGVAHGPVRMTRTLPSGNTVTVTSTPVGRGPGCSGNQVIDVAPGAVHMTTSADGTTTTMTSGSGWSISRSVAPGSAVVVNNTARCSGNSVFTGGNIFTGPGRRTGSAYVSAGVASQHVSGGGTIVNTFIDDDDSTSASSTIGIQTTASGGRIHNVFGSSRTASTSSSSTASSSSSSSSATRKRKVDASPAPAKPIKLRAPPGIANEASAAAGEPVCVVCSDHSAKTVNKPCGHVCLCVTCANVLMGIEDAGAAKPKCPVCQCELTRIAKVNIAAVADTVVTAVAASSSKEPTKPEVKDG